MNDKHIKKSAIENPCIKDIQWKNIGQNIFANKGQNGQKMAKNGEKIFYGVKFYGVKFV